MKRWLLLIVAVLNVGLLAPAWAQSLPEPLIPTLRNFGAVGDGIADDGPALRAACAWSAANQRTVEVPGGIFVAKTLDPSGLGAIVLNPGGTNTGGYPTPVCSLRGQSPVNYPDSMGLTSSSTIMLGNGLNRPLIYVNTASADTSFSDLYLSGNRGNQTGWSGGGGGKLFTIQIADYPTPTFESSLKLNRVVIRDGYNGDLYLGSGRGGLWVRDSWFQYSGQTTSDVALLLNGYDATFENGSIGGNAGSGVLLNEGSQYQFTDGAIFDNGLDAIQINGSKVGYSVFQGVNVQGNGCNGVHVFSAAPFAGAVAGAHIYANMTFDANSATTTGTCSDFLIADSKIETIIAPAFMGASSSSLTKPAYSINLTGTGQAWVEAPQFGTGTPYATAFTNNFGALKGSYNIEPTWTPTLAGSSTAGTPVYTVQAGSWSRSNNEVTAHFKIGVTSLGGATGNLVVNGLPLFSSNVANEVGYCIIANADGWTADAGYTSITAVVGQGSATIYFFENGSGKTIQQTPMSDFAASLVVSGTCFYHTDS